jgi:hypothetical protein
MRTIRSVFVAVLAPALVGCSIHPLPENVTRKTTYDIVEQARCEAKRAVIDYAQGFKNAAVAYEFTFHITETNDASGDVTWSLPFLEGGAFSLMPNAGLHGIRDSNRNFKIIDSFDDLRKADCSMEALEKNWIYPMAGDIGVYEVVATFVRLQKLEHLKVGEVFSFGDTLIFTTTFSAGVKPTLTLSPVTGSFRVIEASAILQAGRTDVHQVVLGLSAGPQAIPAGTANTASRANTANRTITSNLASRSGIAATSATAFPLVSSSSVLTTTLIQDGSSARDRALLELDRQRILALQARTQNLLVGP